MLDKGSHGRLKWLYLSRRSKLMVWTALCWHIGLLRLRSTHAHLYSMSVGDDHAICRVEFHETVERLPPNDH